MTFVNFRATPDLSFPGNAITRCIIRDSHVEPGQGGSTTRPECVVRLWEAPNHLEITGCYWTNGKPVDWAAGVTPSVHTDGPNSRLVYRVENNCDNGWPTIGDPVPIVPGNRTRHFMPPEFEGKANLRGGIRRGTVTLPGDAMEITVDLGFAGEFLPIRETDVSVTPLGPLLAASSWWVADVAADHFTIHTNDEPGGDVRFAWSVDLRRY
jgi:hypothetical protein